MTEEKKVRDLMLGVFEYPHVPYWFTVKKALTIFKQAFLESESKTYPHVLFVFNEKYDLMGIVTLNELIKGVQPKVKGFTIKDADVLYIDEEAVVDVESSLFLSEIKEATEKTISDIMIPAKLFVTPETTVVKAAFLMFHRNLPILPVVENKKFVGVVRLIDVFAELVNIILKEA